MDCDGWHKSMAHFASVCCSSTLNPQGILYDGHDSHFYDRELKILRKHNIHYFILNAGDSVYDYPNNKFLNMNLNKFYGTVIMNWRRDH